MQMVSLAVCPHIVGDSEIVGGSPTIRGTRLSVRAIACLWRATGDRGDLVIRNSSHLSSDDVVAALRRYVEHRAEIDAELIAEATAASWLTMPR